MEPQEIELLARAAHEMNRLYCIGIGDRTQVTWEDAPDWQKESAKNGVRGALNGNTPQQSHESWFEEKKANGWVWGEVKDPEKKTHPCMVDYADLSPEQKAKDDVFIATVRTLAQALGVLPAKKSYGSLLVSMRYQLLEKAEKLLQADSHYAACELMNAYGQIK